MTKAKIRIIAEGITDQLVIGELASAYFSREKIPGIDIEFIAEQPTADKTSGGGWEMVYKWCLSNSRQEREAAYFGSGLFAGDMDAMACDALLIHMDSDICKEIGDKTSITPIPEETDSAAARGLFIRRVLKDWLQLTNEPNSNKHIVAPAVESIESWLVAGLSEQDEAPESNRDIQKRLAELDHLVIRQTNVPTDLKRPKKSLDNYRRIVSVAKENTARVVDACPHFKSMISDISLALT